ncbi:hypothetical protein ASPNIDRAFT_176433 [Aspergillus niger ATCC 1015]|uniref:Zn(2)-C6 fungal-type domain-containing protein n=2 Tax=Aspergillus niger TaxID=5061 RepID=G3YGY0_ASPNA|nr:hypothetical protein ASPNIDRAFT_176433 [Aspergillus niger ATCC 1015]RDH16181.1 hypothetical protein M747DRAFT_359038 [Aspergillus niger ATCC 13496]
MDNAHPSKRRRTTLACDACRARRTKCDSRRPACQYCQTQNMVCVYQEPPPAQPSRVEAELSAMNKRLDQLFSLLVPVAPISPDPRAAGLSDEYDASTEAGASPFDLPSKLLGNSSVMDVLGLDTDFAKSLIRGERTAQADESSEGGRPHLLIVHHRHAVSALAAFSARVHIWYPILASDFSSEYFRVLSGPLQPCSESCLSLLVAAIGHSVAEDMTVSSVPYFETALASLPIIIRECSIRSVQCLMLISLYYCCLLRPCQAHDYCLIASAKIVNIIKSEIAGQLDLARSDIWCLDECVPLPLCQQTWEFTPEMASKALATSSPPHDAPLLNASEDATRSYFLAEVAMRRMLHRCNTAVQATSTGKYVYAPYIAVELERQLEEWYCHLLNISRFDKGDVCQPLEIANVPACPLSNFLRVQYYCCKLSIYWPAVYQAMQDEGSAGLLRDDCQKFFDSYILLTPSIVAAFQDCLVNRWTLFVSLFITSVAAISAASTPCLTGLCSPQFYECIRAAGRADQAIIRRSSSLMILQDILGERIQQVGLS